MSQRNANNGEDELRVWGKNVMQQGIRLSEGSQTDIGSVRQRQVAGTTGKAL